MNLKRKHWIRQKRSLLKKCRNVNSGNYFVVVKEKQFKKGQEGDIEKTHWLELDKLEKGK